MDTPVAGPYYAVFYSIYITHQPEKILFNQPFKITGSATSEVVKSVRVYLRGPVGSIITPALAEVSIPDDERSWEITAKIDDISQWEGLDRLIYLIVVGQFFPGCNGEYQETTRGIIKGVRKFQLQHRENLLPKLGAITAPETVEFRRAFILYITRKNERILPLAIMSVGDKPRYPMMHHQEQSLVEVDFGIYDGREWGELERLGQFSINCSLKGTETTEYVQFTYRTLEES